MHNNALPSRPRCKSKIRVGILPAWISLLTALSISTFSAQSAFAATDAGSAWPGKATQVRPAVRYGSIPQVSQAYLLVTAQGSVIPFGDAGNFGSIAAGSSTGHSGSQTQYQVVGVAPTNDFKGYWILTSDGAVFPYGDAVSYGSLNSPSAPGSAISGPPAVALLTTADSKGYLIVTATGGVHPFGDAVSYGSAASVTLVQPIVSATSTSDGKGYWLVASDGGIFNYGDARYFGSTGNIHLVRPIVGMASTGDSKGYWLVASDGGIFSYGDSRFFGSTGAITLNSPIHGMSVSSDSKGYWMVASDGGIFNYGDAAFSGSAAGHVASSDSVVGIVATQPYVGGGSPVAQKAVTFALSQVGVPYLYGGTGPPGGYDCSGLVMVSFQNTGINLPRGAQDQYYATIPVPDGVALLPGDLVFFGTSTDAISHDGIYIGNGQMVDAPHTGADVRVEDYDWTDYLGATRPAP